MYSFLFKLRTLFWERDWFIGVGAALILWAAMPLLQPVQSALSVWNTRFITPATSEPEVAFIAIDAASRAQFGESPIWNAQLLDLIAPHAAAIALIADLSHAPALKNNVAIDELMTFCTNFQRSSTVTAQVAQLDKFIAAVDHVRAKTVTEQAILLQLRKFYNSLNLSNTLAQEFATVVDRLQAVLSEVSGDAQLIQSLQKSANVVLAASSFTSSQSAESRDLPNFLSNHSLALHNFAVSLPITQVVAPLPEFCDSAWAVGTLPHKIDPYRVPLLTNTGKHLSASVALLLAMKQWRLESAPLQFLPHQGLQLGRLLIETDENVSILPLFHPQKITIDSFAEVLSRRIAPERYQNKVVIVGTLESQPTQVSPLETAYTVASLLGRDFFTTPQWLMIVQVIFVFILLGYVSILLPRLSPKIALVSSGLLLLSIWLLSLNLMQAHYLIAELFPMSLITLSHLGLLLKRRWWAYWDDFRSRPSAIESNRLLGLAFQGQGQLDMAFEKFRWCPINPATLTLLYNLGVDYELKCNYSGAMRVYRYILTYEPFRDSEQRLERLRQAKKTATLQNIDLWSDNMVEKPQLGRYQIERQLGKGAMSVVYLGKDSKLDRLVAIKILALSREFEHEGLAEATTRFFREATAAGRLQHPDIISIYEAGEHYNFAYIAMEFFKGGNLVPYTKPDNLLPIVTVLNIGIRVAEALDYAKKQGVIHRDIKPANIMYNPATEQIKITDFGIAYITDSNQTKTGVILGSPSYMSPEQFAGKLLDGGSDLFSLAVTLFQLLTGQLPFQGTSMANLMYKIAHEPPLDILRIRYEISPRLRQVMERALEKDPQKRFQQGAEFAQALRDCLHEI
jgi:eukaryotic-like serine/threonine-protein kinase